jgi:hypothetical protein
MRSVVFLVPHLNKNRRATSRVAQRKKAYSTEGIFHGHTRRSDGMTAMPVLAEAFVARHDPHRERGGGYAHDDRVQRGDRRRDKTRDKWRDDQLEAERAVDHRLPCLRHVRGDERECHPCHIDDMCIPGCGGAIVEHPQRDEKRGTQDPIRPVRHCLATIRSSFRNLVRWWTCSDPPAFPWRSCMRHPPREFALDRSRLSLRPSFRPVTGENGYVT